jgi:predicted DNA binding CopG/RHH family protein
MKRKRRIKLTPYEKRLEAEIERGEWVEASPEDHAMIAAAIEARKKDAVLNIRINKNDLELLKKKAKKLGVKYQTFIAEMLHRIAHSG